MKGLLGPANAGAEPFAGCDQLWYGLGWIGFALDPTKLSVETPAAEWASQGAQFMHGGTFGSAIHIETVGGGFSWAFCLSAPPHFEGPSDPDHIVEPNGLKAQIRQVLQDFMYKEGGTFEQY